MTTITDFLENTSEKFPDKTAIIFQDKKITFKELEDEVKNNSSFIKKFQNNSVISLLFENSPEFIISYLGVLKSGCIAHVIPANISQDNLEEQISSTHPSAIISSNELFSKISNIENLEIEKINYNEIKPTIYEKKRIDETNYAYLIYTSGTTKKAKGVPITHKNSVFTTNNIVNILKYSSSDIDVIPLPLSHSFGLGCLHTSLFVGSTIILHKNFIKTSEIFESITNYSATTIAAVPFSLTKLIKTESTKVKDTFRNLRLIMTNSTSISSETVKAYKNILQSGMIATYYGLTEASRSTFMIFDDDEKFNSVGKTPEHIQIKINNNDNSEVGEILVKGPNVIKNYWNNLEADKNIVDQWLKTGDLGRIDQDGFLYLLGRTDDIINIAGEKIRPQEIEGVVKVLSDVDEVIALPMKHETLGSTIKLFVKKTDNSEITENEILSFCIRKLERYKVPAKIEFISEFPKTSYGKIKRFMLK